MSLLQGRVGLVTGAGAENGIGFAACRSLAAAGAQVVVTDLVRDLADEMRLQARAAELSTAGSDAIASALDVTDTEQVRACIDGVVDRFGRLDILFNNAGYAGGVGPFLDIADEQFNLGWQVNVMGAVNVCRAVIPVMKARGGGAIVNNSSVAGIGAIPGLAGYSASKFALIGLTKVLAAEFGDDNIRVNAVCPGMVWTDMGREEVELFRKAGQHIDQARSDMAREVPLQRRWADPREIGDAVVYLASDLATYVTGIALPVAGGLAPGL
ncbi:MAG: SDR family oxidoreductase [Proteobacteria bacterium]|nr:SDR family oxidoreductase [Pseudomonadota bacterium]